jgi:hypothetical protein
LFKSHQPIHCCEYIPLLTVVVIVIVVVIIIIDGREKKSRNKQQIHTRTTRVISLREQDHEEIILFGVQKTSFSVVTVYSIQDTLDHLNYILLLFLPFPAVYDNKPL